MSGMRQYIQMMGKEHPSYLSDTWKNYLVEIPDANAQDQNRALLREELRLATLLSGTATALLSIDGKPMEGGQMFIHKLQEKLLSYVKKHSNRIG